MRRESGMARIAHAGRSWRFTSNIRLSSQVHHGFSVFHRRFSPITGLLRTHRPDFSDVLRFSPFFTMIFHHFPWINDAFPPGFPRGSPRGISRQVKHPALGVVRLDYDYPPAPGDSDHPGAPGDAMAMVTTSHSFTKNIRGDHTMVTRCY